MVTKRVLVNGAAGRMGQLTVQAITAHPTLTLVGTTGKQDKLSQAIQDSQADVVIDFTHPSVVFANTMAILEAGAMPIIGTTGLSSREVITLQQQCLERRLKGIIATNFSLMAALIVRCAQDIVQYFPNVEIIEMHHPDKADSPCGTALYMAERLASVQDNLNQAVKATTHEMLAGSRGGKHHQVPIHAVRLPGLLSHQQIIFGGSGETLTIRHDSISRDCFVQGLYLACEKVQELEGLVYGLENILYPKDFEGRRDVDAGESRSVQ